jgi:hypothetical protein
MKIYHLNKTDRGWEIRVVGADRALFICKTKNETLLKFQETIGLKATPESPLTLRVHKEDGKLQAQRVYPRAVALKGSKEK